MEYCPPSAAEHKIVFIDIETTGFEADKRMVCFAVKPLGGEGIAVGNRDGDGAILNDLADTVLDLYNNGYRWACSYNGENFKKGFDFPFLRTFHVQNDRKWPFGGMGHLDLMPLMMRYMNFQMEEKKGGYKLDNIYAVLNGPPLGSEDMSGKDVPPLYQEYLDTGDEKIMDRIEAYNLTDVIQTDYVYQKVIDYLPKNTVGKAWTEL